MRQTREHRLYLGSASVPRTCFPNARGVLLSRHSQTPAGRTACGRRGFTLIEVVVAMSILVVVVLALLSSYTFYYRSITNLRVQSIGENLAQLQLEDVRNLGSSSFVLILGGHWDSDSSTSPAGPTQFPPRFPTKYNCPNYPPAELFYDSNHAIVGWYSYVTRKDETEPIGPDNLPSWVDNSVTPSAPIDPTDNTAYLPKDQTALDNLKESLASITYSSSNVPLVYDSGKRDTDFVVEGLTSIPGGLVLPASILVTPSASGAPPYTLDISKWTYPYFKKRITITDESPNETELAKKLHKVGVTVYWTVSGVQKSYTVEQEVGFEGQT